MHDNKKITILAAVALVLAAIATVTLATRDRHHEEAVAQAPVTKKPVKKAIAKAVQKAKTDTTDTVKTDTLVEGYITDTDGKGISRVVVSDGYQCVLTDTTGHYQFMRHAKARFVFSMALGSYSRRVNRPVDSSASAMSMAGDSRMSSVSGLKDRPSTARVPPSGNRDATF